MKRLKAIHVKRNLRSSFLQTPAKSKVIWSENQAQRIIDLDLKNVS